MPNSHRPLTLTDLLPHGPLRRLGQRVSLLKTIGSTNQFLLEQATEAADGTVAHAEQQTSGRGRLGRRWAAPRGSSILLSVLLIEPADTPLLSQGALLAALAACEAIEAATDCTPVVRWPNDLVLGGRKLGGVLAESSLLPAGKAESSQRAVVIGVGINCLQHRGHFTGPLAQTATSLECESTHTVDRGSVAANLLNRLDHWLVLCGEKPDGWAQMRSAWRRRCEDVGTRVTLEHDARTFTGTALDIADNGDLVVQLDEGGRRHFAAATTTRAW